MNDRANFHYFEHDGQVAQLRIPPHSIEAESSVLGSLLLDNSGWDRVGDLLAEDDFYRHEHRLVFATIARLINACKPADVITVFAELEKQGKHTEAGGLPYLHALAQVALSGSNIRRYAEIVRERAVLRKLIGAADEISTAAFNVQGREVEGLLDEAMQKVMAISPDARDDDWESAEVGMVRVLNHIQAVAEGSAKVDVISLGLKDLDERLDGGGRPGEVIVIGARPSMGKSALGLTIGTATAEAGEPTAVWTGEMPADQMWNRALSLKSSVHLSRLKRAERLRDFDWPGITRGVDSLVRIPFFVNDTPSMTIGKLRAKARALKRKRGLRVLVVDHLGLMEPTDPRAPRHQQIGDITRGLKRLAKELGLIVVLLVQLNRELEKRVDPSPVMSDLRESGDIEQDADIVMFVHRPIYYKPDLGDEWKYYAKLIVAKLRDGSPGAVHTQFIGENTRFMDWPEETPIPTNQVRVARTNKNSGGDL